VLLPPQPELPVWVHCSLHPDFKVFERLFPIHQALSFGHGVATVNVICSDGSLEAKTLGDRLAGRRSSGIARGGTHGVEHIVSTKR